MALGTSEWRKLPLSLTELCIDTTLRCGQSFRWRMISDEWHCALHGRIVSLKQDPQHLHYRVTWPMALVAPLTPPASASASALSSTDHISEAPSIDDTEALLISYFNLSHSLTTLYAQWSSADANFRKRAPGFTGVRILNQDAWEALVGFICSSNNNIARISQMVHKLCLHYGVYIGIIDDQRMHDFPTPSSLTAPGVEAHLRELGFGYRARYIAQTARDISQGRPTGWLQSLRNPVSIAWEGAASASVAQDFKEQPSYKHAHEQLLQLTGVGPKVADCVCLMGLGWGEAVPVDTHVWQIAMRDYKFGGKSKNKTLTKAMYDAVGDHFRGLWGDQAGWAHSVLFTADLRTFSDRVVGKVEGDFATKGVKLETAEQSALVTPISTPVATPLKRKRTAKAEDVEVDVKLEDALVSLSAARVTKKSRRRQM